MNTNGIQHENSINTKPVPHQNKSNTYEYQTNTNWILH